jgi:hypothetical protein
MKLQLVFLQEMFPKFDGPSTMIDVTCKGRVQGTYTHCYKMETLVEIK